MYYIEETEEEYRKYKVDIDEQKLKQLRMAIIENCSTINHVKDRVVVGYNPYRDPDVTIKNYKSKVVGTKEYIDGPDEDICEVEYDEYNHPELVINIDKLLNGYLEVISAIKAPTSDDSPKSLIEIQIERTLQELTKESSKHSQKVSLTRLEELVSTLKHEYQQLKLNEKQKPITKYREEVISCIQLTLVKRISKDIVEQVESFYEDTNQKIKKRGEK